MPGVDALPPLQTDQPAFVFENPSLIAEAATRRWTGPPLICSSGRPTVAVVTLLRQLGAAGAPMLQHADHDATGLAITAWLAERAGTTPWRMPDVSTSSDHPVYEEALRDELLELAATWPTSRG